MFESKLLSNIISVFNTKVIVLFLGLIGTVLISRGLGAEGRGLLAALLIYPQLLVSIFEGGMRQATVLFLGKKIASESDVLGATFIFTFVSSLLGYLFVLCLLFNFGPDNNNLSLFIISALVLPISIAVSSLKGYFLGKQKIQRFNRLAWVEKLIYAVGVIFIYYFGTVDVSSVLLLTILSSLINLILGIWFFSVMKPNIGSFKLITFKSMFKIGVVYGIGLFLIDANYKVDILILSWLSNFNELGTYTLAVKLSELLWQLPGAIVVVLLSKGANSTSKEMVPIIAKTIRVTLLVTFFLAIGLCIFSHLFVGLIFGLDFEDVPLIVTTLIPGVMFMVVFKTINTFYAGQGKPHYSIFIMGVAVLINILFNFILIPYYGALGAAVASNVSYFVSSFIIMVTFCRKEKVPICDVLIIQKLDFPFAKKNKLN